MTQNIGLERSFERLPDQPVEKKSGWLGATIQGTFRIRLLREPSKVYVRFPDNSFLSAVNDAGFYVRDESDPDNHFISVEVEKDSRNIWHVKRQSSELDAQLQRRPDLFLEEHMHVPGDIGDDETDSGNMLVSDGAAFQSVDPRTVLITKSMQRITTTDPTVNDDSGDGYEAGYSWWLNTSSGQIFDLVDDSLGAAVWVRRGSGSGSLDKVLVDDDGIILVDDDGTILLGD